MKLSQSVICPVGMDDNVFQKRTLAIDICHPVTYKDAIITKSLTLNVKKTIQIMTPGTDWDVTPISNYDERSVIVLLGDNHDHHNEESEIREYKNVSGRSYVVLLK